MSEQTVVPQESEKFGEHTIRFVRVQPVPETELFAAVVVIAPGTVSPPDLVLGFGLHELEARRDAFEQAKSRLRRI